MINQITGDTLNREKMKNVSIPIMLPNKSKEYALSKFFDSENNFPNFCPNGI